MVVSGIFNLFKRIFPGMMKKRANNKLVLWFRRHVANPALFGFKHSTPVKWGPINMSLPTRAQTWVLCGYFVMFIIFMFIKYDIYDGNSRFATRSLQISRYVADRSGIIAMSQLPLLFLFAGRNNLTLLITGWSYDTMNVYHRWVARVMYLCIFIHGVCFSVFYKMQGSYNEEFESGYMRWAFVAIVCGGFLMFFSLRHFREKVYEFFLWFHRLFVIFFTVGVWYHTKPHGYMEWLYAAIAIWAFDHACRLGRIVFSGVTAKADLQLCGHEDNDGEFIKLKVTYSHVWGPRPGAYAFIYYLKPFLGFWENHPFSCYPSPIPGEENKMVFCMRILGGKTLRMAKYLSDKPNRQQTVPIFIDGPYGQTFPIENNDTLVFIAGGIGFTGTFSYASHLKHHGANKRVVFIWISRSTGNISVFKDELDYLGKEGHVDIQLYITNQEESNSSKSDLSIQNEKKDGDLDEVNEKSSVSSDSSSRTTVTYGIPNISELVMKYISESSGGSTGFLVCGPPGLNDSVRKSVTENMGKGNGNVDLYVEAFNW